MNGKFFSRIAMSLLALTLMIGVAPLKHAAAANAVPASNLTVSVKYCRSEFHWTPAHTDGWASSPVGDRQRLDIISSPAGSSQKVFLPPEASSYVAEGLAPYTTYTARVRAEEHGQPFSNTVTFQTHACSPFNPL